MEHLTHCGLNYFFWVGGWVVFVRAAEYRDPSPQWRTNEVRQDASAPSIGPGANPIRSYVVIR